MTLGIKTHRTPDPKRQCDMPECQELTIGRFCEGHAREGFPRDMSTVNKNRGAFKFDHDSVRYG